jgi:hypothetical protein
MESIIVPLFLKEIMIQDKFEMADRISRLCCKSFLGNLTRVD